jgi:ferric-dicitrate binding protein FerR (iron transport regulator)
MEIQNIPWEAISAKLNNTAEAGDTRKIQDWLDLSPENAMILTEIIDTWSVTKGKPEFYQPDLTYNWNKLFQRINHKPDKKRSLILFSRLVGAAAVLVLVFIAGITLSDQFISPAKTITYSKIISPKGNKTQVILPDSSKVWLNSGAELWYPSDYTANNREVWMKGECYFQIEKDPDHPLVVHGSKLQVKVFGTSFNLNEDDRRDQSDVTLVTGKVEILDLLNEKITDLVPGQRLSYCNGVGKIQSVDNMEASTSWINNILIFKNQPFDEVIHYLHGWYGVNIRLDRSAYYHHNYTFKVKTESLREVLELITIITPIDYKIEGDQVTIKYKQKVP